MKKYILVSLTVITMLATAVLFNFIAEKPALAQLNSEVEVNTPSKLAKIYSLALDSTLPIDPALNDKMSYIAIDTNTLKNITKEDKDYIFRYFGKYNVPVLDESFDSLKKKGMVKDLNALDGILLTIGNLKEISSDKIELEATKFRTGLGAIGVKVTLQLENGDWKVTSSHMQWISEIAKSFLLC